jgi:hypothetical protein
MIGDQLAGFVPSPCLGDENHLELGLYQCMACKGGDGGINNFTQKAEANKEFVISMAYFKDKQFIMTGVSGKSFVDDLKSLFASTDDLVATKTTGGSFSYSIMNINDDTCGDISGAGCSVNVPSDLPKSQAPKDVLGITDAAYLSYNLWTVEDPSDTSKVYYKKPDTYADSKVYFTVKNDIFV